MKRMVTLLLTCILLASTTGCFSDTKSSQPTQPPTTQYIPTTPPTTTPKKLTTSEKKSIAEREALKQLLSALKGLYGPSSIYKYREYDIEATRYQIGSFTQNGNEFTIKGTLYLYNVYGRLTDTATFSSKVIVEDDGSYKAYWPTINLD